jgi:hypothetical protein
MAAPAYTSSSSSSEELGDRALGSDDSSSSSSSAPGTGPASLTGSYSGSDDEDAPAIRLSLRPVAGDAPRWEGPDPQKVAAKEAAAAKRERVFAKLDATKARAEAEQELAKLEAEEERRRAQKASSGGGGGKSNLRKHLLFIWGFHCGTLLFVAACVALAAFASSVAGVVLLATPGAVWVLGVGAWMSIFSDKFDLEWCPVFTTVLSVILILSAGLTASVTLGNAMVWSNDQLMYVESLDEMTPENTGAHIGFVFGDKNENSIVLADAASQITTKVNCATELGTEFCEGFCVAPFFTSNTVPPANATLPVWAGCFFTHKRKTSEDNAETDGFSCRVICGPRRNDPYKPYFGLSGWQVSVVLGGGWDFASEGSRGTASDGWEDGWWSVRGLMYPEHIPGYGEESQNPTNPAFGEFEPPPKWWNLIGAAAVQNGWNVESGLWGAGNARNELRTMEETDCIPGANRKCGSVGEFAVGPHPLVLDVNRPVWEWYVQRIVVFYAVCGILYPLAAILDVAATVFVAKKVKD